MARGFAPAVATVLLSNLAMYTLLLSLPLFLAVWGSAQVGLLLAGLSVPTVFFSPLGGGSPTASDGAPRPSWGHA